MECKLLYPRRIYVNLCISFNLNLLECKFWFWCTNHSNTAVLISTYWNVNACPRYREAARTEVLISTYWNVNFDIRNRTGLPICFNLNLLECKLLYQGVTMHHIVVLISTYWNVNEVWVIPTNEELLVLISTYWNVNTQNVMKKIGGACFNLNLLECKFNCLNDSI